MSDYMCKIIPESPDLRIPSLRMLAARSWLRTHIQSDRVTCRLSEMPVFVDCGGDLENIRCPLCGAGISFDWWGEAMDQAAAGSFQDRRVVAPCCGSETALDELLYEFPCGFSCAELDLVNPRMPLESQMLVKLGKILGTPLRRIDCHL